MPASSLEPMFFAICHLRTEIICQFVTRALTSHHFCRQFSAVIGPGPGWNNGGDTVADASNALNKPLGLLYNVPLEP